MSQNKNGLLQNIKDRRTEIGVGIGLVAFAGAAGVAVVEAEKPQSATHRRLEARAERGLKTNLEPAADRAGRIILKIPDSKDGYTPHTVSEDGKQIVQIHREVDTPDQHFDIDATMGLGADGKPNAKDTQDVEIHGALKLSDGTASVSAVEVHSQDPYNDHKGYWFAGDGSYHSELKPDGSIGERIDDHSAGRMTTPNTGYGPYGLTAESVRAKVEMAHDIAPEVVAAAKDALAAYRSLHPPHGGSVSKV
jgi:hypothetical protein